MTNPLWRTILERISLGEEPFGTRIYNHVLYYKQQNISLSDCSVDHVIDFFKYIVGLNPQYIHFNSWKDIKRKIIKDNLLLEYVTRLSAELTLTDSQTRYLLSCIHLAITLKRVLPSDIVLNTWHTENNTNIHTYIQEINNVIFEYDDVNIRLRFNGDNLEDSDTSDDEDEMIGPSENLTSDQLEESDDVIDTLDEDLF